MQFWGENRSGVDATMRPEDFDRFQKSKPTVIALYGPNRTNLEDYARSLPIDLRLGPLNCIDFDWPTLPSPAHACIATLH